MNDAAYMDAVSRGDMVTAQRMVDAAAKKAGYAIGPVFHGSDKQFSVFDVSKIGQKHGRSEGAGFYFTTDRSTAEGYTPKGGTLYSVYLKVGKILDFDSKPFTPSQLKKLLKAVALQEQKDGLTDSWKDGFLSNYEDTYSMSLDSAVSKAVSYFESEKTALDQIGGIVGSGVDAATVNKALASSLGYDAFASKGFSGGGKSGGIIYVATSPSQIKSADPVTYDDAGNVIPLSQRFSDKSEDIRNPKRKIKRGLRKNPATPEDFPHVSGSRMRATPQTKTEAFKRWFNGSIVVNQDGSPRVMYHGTGWTDIGQFKSYRAFGKIAGHFAFDPEFASEFAEVFATDSYSADEEDDSGTKKYATVYPVYLSLKKLFDVRKKEDRDAIVWVEEKIKGRGWDWTQLEKAPYVIKMKSKGFDGYLDFEKGSDSQPTGIAVFDPRAIKSATANRGTFDPTDPDIRNPRRSMIRTKLSRIIEPGDRVLDYDRAQGEDLYRLWDLVHTDMPLNTEALTEIEGLLDDDGVLVIQSGEEPSGLKDHFRRATRYQGMLLVQGPMNPEEARINTEKLRRDLE